MAHKEDEDIPNHPVLVQNKQDRKALVRYKQLEVHKRFLPRMEKREARTQHPPSLD